MYIYFNLVVQKNYEEKFTSPFQKLSVFFYTYICIIYSIYIYIVYIYIYKIRIIYIINTVCL